MPRRGATSVRHVAPAPDLVTPMGKVGGVLTGLRLASHERVIIADDDVRYDDESLRARRRARSTTPTSCDRRTTSSRCRGTRAGTRPHAAQSRDRRRLAGHARRASLRCSSAPAATTAARCSRISSWCARWSPPADARRAARRVRGATSRRRRAISGRSASGRPTTRSRGRGALAVQLALLPGAIALGARVRLARASCSPRRSSSALAEAGRRRAGGARVFPVRASLLAPAWVAERAVCSWLARRRRACSSAACRIAAPCSATPLRRCGCCGAPCSAVAAADADAESRRRSV